MLIIVIWHASCNLTISYSLHCIISMHGVCVCVGGLAIAVPGELKGLELASKKYGQLDWKALLQPAIDIADEGFEISEAIADAIEEVRHDLETGKYPGLQ